MNRRDFLKAAVVGVFGIALIGLLPPSKAMTFYVNTQQGFINALECATSGDTIYLGPGEYDGKDTVFVGGRITIAGGATLCKIRL